MTRKSLAFACLALCAVALGLNVALEHRFKISRAHAQEPSVVGVWKLKTFRTKVLDTDKSEDNYGANPVGTLIMTKGGHYSYMGFADGRKVPAAAKHTDEERIALFTSMFAHFGTFELKGADLTFKIAGAWNNQWGGTVQKRLAKFEGNNKFSMETQTVKRALDGKDIVVSLTFERVD